MLLFAMYEIHDIVLSVLVAVSVGNSLISLDFVRAPMGVVLQLMCPKVLFRISKLDVQGIPPVSKYL